MKAVLSAAAVVAILAATVVTATPALAAGSAVVTIAQDGTPNFDDAAGPGRDVSATNGIVRTGDTVTYSFSYSIDGGGARNPVIRSELPAGMSWLRVPVECSRAGSLISAGPNGSATILSCNLPTAAAAISSRLTASASVSRLRRLTRTAPCATSASR